MVSVDTALLRKKVKLLVSQFVDGDLVRAQGEAPVEPMLATDRLILRGLLEVYETQREMGEGGPFRKPPSKALKGHWYRHPDSFWVKSELSTVLPAAASGEIHYLNAAGFYAALAGCVHTYLEEAEAEDGEDADAGQIEKRLLSALGWHGALVHMSLRIMRLRHGFFKIAVRDGLTVAKDMALCVENQAELHVRDFTWRYQNAKKRS